MIDAAVRYACPMHPEVRAKAPGECPICRMALERVGKPAAAPTRATAADSADFAAVENVRRHNIVDFVRRRSLLVPARELRGPAAVARGRDGLGDLLRRRARRARRRTRPGRLRRRPRPSSRFASAASRAPASAGIRSTSRVRFRFTAAGRDSAPPRALDVGWVELAPRPRQVLTVPASALLQSPEGPYVLAWTGAGFNFEKRPIELGETFLKQGFAVVLSGLRVNERVVGRATFFLEADRRAASRAIETGWSSL